MAVIARKLEKQFNEEYRTFNALCDELENINQMNIKEEMQAKVTKFFSLFREKVDEIERKVTFKIEGSSNLNSLITTIEEMHTYMSDNQVMDKYDREKSKLDEKINESRFTYLS